MNQTWIRKFRHRICALVFFFVFLSILSWKGISFAEVVIPENRESIQITTRFPGKTALQIEESITKPWEQILKSISGYRQIESISEEGTSFIHLKFEPGVGNAETIQTIRNEYLLQRQRFPKDSLFPRIQSGKLEDEYIVILQRIKEKPNSTRKELEQKIRNITGVLSFVHHSDKEQEIVLEIKPERIQRSGLPSLSIIFSALRNHSFGFSSDLRNGLWFQKDHPLEPKDWSEVPIPSRLGESLRVSAISSVSFGEKELRHGTRINGQSSETIIIKAESNTALYHIITELKSILNEHNDWVLLYSSHEDFINDLIRSFFLFFSVDFVLVVFCRFFGKSKIELLIHLFVYYISFILFLGICNFMAYPVGRAFLFSFIFWKYLLFVYPIRKFGIWARQVLYSFLIFSLFVILDWLPKSFYIFSLCHIYFIFFYSFLVILFKPIKKDSDFKIEYDFPKWISFLKRKESEGSKTIGKTNKLFFLGLFWVGVFSSLVSSFSFYSLNPSLGKIQIAKLEFPTSIPEQESIRITKQVEDSILKQNLTDLLVVKQNRSSSDFYFRLNDLDKRNGFQNLPTESGYFHVLGGGNSNVARRLRFANANTESLEKTILGLIPWLQHKARVEEVVLCFQPQAEGMELHSPNWYGNLLDLERVDLFRERSLSLQSAIVGKMVWKNRLTDVRFSVKQDKEGERYLEKPIQMNSGSSVHNQSFTKSEKIKIPGRIYRKNGETSLEILVKGKEIQWKDLESKIHKVLEKDPVRLSEMTEEKGSEKEYQPFFLFVIVAICLYRKKEKFRSLISLLCFLLLWRINLSALSDDYLLFGCIATLLLFLILCSPSKSLRVDKQIPLVLLLFLFYFLPGDGGKFFLEGMVLVFSFFLFNSKLHEQWKFFKTKLSF
ncbi:efflux RND transporter permease subunit [Leptospira noumeaensis]|uniref:Efflux RND transporter permease subunit n=1 Tax=Leptospira noumeaensis TaxID=2484964 RepID=A0A4R9IGC8_9LEPT|nr:efflux RND transporter permease subunit [Leptospira noumeaensis]TGK87454.1 efflux RND transporter permease subunit [Leptospira noumeaensis]